MEGRFNSALGIRVFVAVALALLATTSWALAGYKVTHGEPPVTRIDRGLVTSNRTTLSICVDSKTPDVSNQTLKASIAAALGQVTAHPDFVPAGLAVAPPQVDVGCPGPARMLLPGFNSDSGSATAESANVVQPSEYRTFVFVVPRQTATLPDGNVVHEVPQEYLCEGEVCPEVTTALYLTPGDLSDPVSLVRMLTGAVGLDPDPTTPEPFK